MACIALYIYIRDFLAFVVSNYFNIIGQGTFGFLLAIATILLICIQINQ